MEERCSCLLEGLGDLRWDGQEGVLGEYGARASECPVLRVSLRGADAPNHPLTCFERCRTTLESLGLQPGCVWLPSSLAEGQGTDEGGAVHIQERRLRAQLCPERYWYQPIRAFPYLQRTGWTGELRGADSSLAQPTVADDATLFGLNTPGSIPILSVSATSPLIMHVVGPSPSSPFRNLYLTHPHSRHLRDQHDPLPHPPSRLPRLSHLSTLPDPEIRHAQHRHLHHRLYPRHRGRHHRPDRLHPRDSALQRD